MKKSVVSNIPASKLPAVNTFYTAIFEIILRYHELSGLAIVPWKGPGGDWCFCFTVESLLRPPEQVRPDESLLKEGELLCSQRGFIYGPDGTPIFPTFDVATAQSRDYERWILETLEFKKFFDKWADMRPNDQFRPIRDYVTQIQAILSLEQRVEMAQEGKDPERCIGYWKINECLYWKPWEGRIYSPKAERGFSTGGLPFKAIAFLAKRLYIGMTDPLKREKGQVTIYGNDSLTEGWSYSLDRLPDGTYLMINGSCGCFGMPWDENLVFVGTAEETRKRFGANLGADIVRRII